ncbi:MAG: pyroglutamyl-peptidase I [Vagococcus sp.]
MNILVTGFDPFDTAPINPSIEAVRQLPSVIGEANIIPLEIPTVFHDSVKKIKSMLESKPIDYIICVGQAGGREAITPERIAINIDDARIPDNKGNQPIDTLIQKTGPSAYFSQLPIKAMVKSLQEEMIPAEVSNTAGTFVCNHIMYQCLHLTHTAFKETKAGFIHVPFIPEQVDSDSRIYVMALETIVKALVIIIETIIAYDGHEDAVEIGGALH